MPVVLANLAAFALKNWKLVAGGAALAVMAVMLLLARSDARHWHKLADQRAKTIAQVQIAQKLAAAAARKAIADTEARYRSQANAADTTHTAELADARTAADRYIADHRVPACPVFRQPSNATSAAQGGDPGVPASVPPNGLVAVSEADVRSCSDAVTYAWDARAWAMGLGDPTQP